MKAVSREAINNSDSYYCPCGCEHPQPFRLFPSRALICAICYYWYNRLSYMRRHGDDDKGQGDIEKIRRERPPTIASGFHS